MRAATRPLGRVRWGLGLGLLAGCGVPRPTPGLRPVSEAAPEGEVERALGRGTLGARLGLGASTLSVGRSDRHPDTFWQPGLALGLNAERALNRVLSLRPEVSWVLKGAATESPGPGGTVERGHVNLWYLAFTPQVLARFRPADARVRPFLGLGPFAAWRLHTGALVGRQALPRAEAAAPYGDLDLGLQLGGGLWLDPGRAYGLFSVDLGVELGLWNVAAEAYAPYAGDQVLRTLTGRLGVTWHFFAF